MVRKNSKQESANNIQTESPDYATDTDRKSDDELAKQEDHHEVRHAGSRVEFSPGVYLVSKSFSNYQQAEDFSDQLFSKGYRDVRVGRIAGRSGWYVSIKRYSSTGSAQSDRNRLKSKISGIWVLKVN